VPRWEEGVSIPRARIGATVTVALLLAGCSTKIGSTVDPRYGISSSPRVVEYGQPVPKGGGVYKLGPSYTVAGRTYVPREDIFYRAEGIASWYGNDFHGRLTANGEIYDMDGISAAHPTLPMPCFVRVTNLGNKRSLIVRVNDRGPYAADREIDLSGKAAELLGFRHNGIARVRVEYVGPAPLEGTDDLLLQASLRQGVPAPVPPGIMLASSRWFIPFSTRPPALIPMPSDVPVPGERPFALGVGELTAVAPNPAGSRDPRAASDSGYVPASYDESSVAAFSRRSN
jgi:rare lipoprotein A